ncbi:MAG: ADP-ribosylglycohydrolase family protein [Candidatus Eremiobacteraeota bacterium]|nr:ADP-ribosylglycohydrolase family protein [Candidatus Eremiobacteraeota bacterium]
MQAKITHGHPAAVAAAQAVAVLVHDAIAGRPISLDMPAGIDEPTFSAAWHGAHRNLIAGERLPAHLRNAAMSGWVTVATAHAIAVLYKDDPERAIGMAAASGGDTDTVACIVGALVGARHGRAFIPKRWLNNLAAQAVDSCNYAANALRGLRDVRAAAESGEALAS